MNIESFVIGILTVVVMVVAITAVLGLLKAIRLSAEVIGLKQRLTDDERELSREINMVEQTLQNQLDHRMNDTRRMIENYDRDHHDRINHLNSYIDQRVDKLEAKLTGTIKSSKEVLKG